MKKPKKPKTRFHHAKPGEKIVLRLSKGRCVWTIKCCDCGLEHVILLVPKRRELHIGAWRLDDVLRLALPKAYSKRVSSPNPSKASRGATRNDQAASCD
jgi:hypothetical protein